MNVNYVAVFFYDLKLLIIYEVLGKFVIKCIDWFFEENYFFGIKGFDN